MKINHHTSGQLYIIFFDGICVLCNSFADFILKVDKKRVFKLSPLQGVMASKVLDFKNTQELKSIILYTDSRIYYATDALIEIFRLLPYPYKLGRFLIFIPRPIRDYLYYQVAKYRYKIFGKKQKCRLPSQQDVGRFID